MILRLVSGLRRKVCRSSFARLSLREGYDILERSAILNTALTTDKSRKLALNDASASAQRCWIPDRSMVRDAVANMGHCSGAEVQRSEECLARNYVR